MDNLRIKHYLAKKPSAVLGGYFMSNLTGILKNHTVKQAPVFIYSKKGTEKKKKGYFMEFRDNLMANFRDKISGYLMKIVL